MMVRINQIKMKKAEKIFIGTSLACCLIAIAFVVKTIVAVPMGQGGGEIIRGDLFVEGGTTWRAYNGDDIFKIYVKGSNGDGENMSDDFDNALIIEKTSTENINNIETCFYDKNTNRMIQCLNHGEANHATTIYRSLQVVGNDKLPNDGDFTECVGYNDIDCATDITGADLGVEDDIEAKGSIFAQEELKIGGIIGDSKNVLCRKPNNEIGTCATMVAGLATCDCI
jgi:hypothetical protein